MAHRHLPAGPSFPFWLRGSHAPLLELTCFEHSPRPLVFSPAQSQFQFTAALSTHLAGIPGLLPQAGLSGPRRSLVTGWGTKSLFAKHSLSGAHFPLALPLTARLGAHSQGDLWGNRVVSAGIGGRREAASLGLTLGWELGALRCQTGPLPSRPSRYR